MLGRASRARGRHEIAVARLQRAIVLALVGEQEIGPAQLVVQRARARARAARLGSVALEAIEAGRESPARAAPPPRGVAGTIGSVSARADRGAQHAPDRVRALAS